jgi:redox-sensitive bicupin YhaK (pirin superfamily)
MEVKDAELHPDCSPYEPASTFFHLRKGGSTSLTLPEGHCAHGAALANDSDIAREAQFVLLDRTGEVTLEANNDATVLILSNAPIDEPVHSSFIINTTDGIRQGMIDFQSGRFGAISALNHKPRECVLMRRRKNYKPQES